VLQITIWTWAEERRIAAAKQAFRQMHAPEDCAAPLLSWKEE
jgi:hypothetical protein